MVTDDGGWRDVDDVFSRALEVPEADRPRFLEQTCGDDSTLRTAVEELLIAADDSAAFLESSVEASCTLPWEEVFPAPTEGEVPDERVGERVGPYQIVERIGRGGMATVYRAERADGEWSQQVALKLIRRGLDTGDVVRRFLAERQILSSLEHPHIARLLDGGTTADGLPYLVMELVDGIPISTYCDEARLPVQSRLRLFCDVCRAVRYAHGNLVVHRDLKPSNILVTKEGIPKLLDFGIAKLLSETDDGSRTRTGRQLLTPQYASPEQVRNESITTSTDVYQLGVLLCSLLSGHRPYEVEGLSLAQVELKITDSIAERPSRLVDDKAAAARASTVDHLTRRLRGDLDTIVMKALRKRAKNRYGSVEALLNDVDRHLDGHPIAAAPATKAYRIRKWIARNKAGAIAALVGFLVLAAWAITATMQAEALAVERDRARDEGARAAQVRDFLVGLFDRSSPYRSGRAADSMTARELLDAGVRQLDADLRDQPLVRAEILYAIGRTYAHLDVIGPAVALFEESLVLHREIEGELGPTVARDLHALAAATGRRDLDSAVVLFERALSVAEVSLGPSDLLVAGILTSLALNGERSGKIAHDSAKVLHNRALTILRSHADVPREQLANALTISSYGLPDRGDTIGLVRMREALAIRRELYGSDHPSVAGNLNDLGLAVRYTDRAEADRLLAESVDIFEATLGLDHGTTRAVTNNLAGSRVESGDLDSAADLYEAQIAQSDSLTGDPRYLARAQMGLGKVWMRRGQDDVAEPLLRAAYDYYTTSQGAPIYRRVEAGAALGECLHRLERYQDAEGILTETHELGREVATNVAPAIQRQLLTELAGVYEALGRAEEQALVLEELSALEP